MRIDVNEQWETIREQAGPKALRQRLPDENIGGVERAVTIATGAGLVAFAWNRRTPAAAVAGGLGGALILRGAIGHSPVYERLKTKRTERLAAIGYEEGVGVVQSVTILKSPEELYSFWRKLENLPRVMRHVKKIDRIDETHSQWTVRGPGRKKLTWNAEIIRDEPGRFISWRCDDGKLVRHAGSVHFDRAPGDRGTVITVELRYEPLGGKGGALLAKLFREDPAHQVSEDLRNLKATLEAGEIPTTEGQPAGR